MFFLSKSTILYEQKSKPSNKLLIDFTILFSLHPLVFLNSLMNFVRSNFHVNNDAEITWEATPETLLNSNGEAKIKTLLVSGVNRLSIGVQSFEDALLRIMGRRHKALDAIKAFKESGRPTTADEIREFMEERLENHRGKNES